VTTGENVTNPTTFNAADIFSASQQFKDKVGSIYLNQHKFSRHP